LTKDGLAARDQLVIQACQSHRVPLTIVMAGGYADNVKDIVDIHTHTVLMAARAAAPQLDVSP
jgi:acetoin utilization deacetylase AcuC-like enzyme